MAEKKDEGELQNVKIARTYSLSVPVVNAMRKLKRDEKITDFSVYIENLIKKDLGLK